MSKAEINFNKYFSGTVIPGSGKSTKVGFPTANINVSNEFELAYGVYACKVNINNARYNGILHYSPKLVLGEIVAQFEVHLIGLNRDINGEQLNIELLSYIRGAMKFADEQKLKKQIASDREKAEKIFANQS